MSKKQARFLRAKMLGALIRDARLDAGKSLKETAALIGCGTSTLSSFEHGRKSISLPELEILAYHLDMPIRQFLSPSPQALGEERDIKPEIMITLRQRMIGAMLRKHRNEKDLSIRQLAEMVEMPPSRLSAFERGERPISIPDLESILEVLDLPLDDFMNQEGPVGEWHRNQRAFEHFSNLPRSLRDFFIDPENEAYLEVASRLSGLDLDQLRSVLYAAKGILD